MAKKGKPPAIPDPRKIAEEQSAALRAYRAKREAARAKRKADESKPKFSPPTPILSGKELRKEVEKIRKRVGTKPEKSKAAPGGGSAKRRKYVTTPNASETAIARRNRIIKEINEGKRIKVRDQRWFFSDSKSRLEAETISLKQAQALEKLNISLSAKDRGKRFDDVHKLIVGHLDESSVFQGIERMELYQRSGFDYRVHADCPRISFRTFMSELEDFLLRFTSAEIRKLKPFTWSFIVAFDDSGRGLGAISTKFLAFDFAVRSLIDDIERYLQVDQSRVSEYAVVTSLEIRGR